MPPRLALPDRSPPDRTPPDRLDEVLDAALSLVSEKGIAGASLRALAKELDLSQPSLYHYFSSKDDLVDQLVEMGARHMVDSMGIGEFGRVELSRLPHLVKERIFALWNDERHVRYSRFLFIVAIESPRHRPIIERAFRERLLSQPSGKILEIFAKDPVLGERVVQALLMLARALALALIEERILFGRAKVSAMTLTHADFVANTVKELLSHMSSRPKLREK